MKKQISLIVRDQSYSQVNQGNTELNNYLNQGFTVVQMCPMPSSCFIIGDYKSDSIKFHPTCLVILEKNIN